MPTTSEVQKKPRQHSRKLKHKLSEELFENGQEKDEHTLNSSSAEQALEELQKQTVEEAPKPQLNNEQEAKRTMGTTDDTSKPNTTKDSASKQKVSTEDATAKYKLTAEIPAAGEHVEYKPTGGNQPGFNKNCRPITLEHLLIQQENEDNDETDNDDDNEELSDETVNTLVSTPFLWVMLLGISKAQTDAKIDYTAFKKQKRGKMQTSYKHKYLFASLNDKSLTTCVILEKNNDEHNVHWSWNRNKHDVTIGIKLAIQNPRVMGFLPTQSAIIETKLPFIMLAKPAIQPAPIIADTTAHNMKYFILKAHKISIVQNHLAVPWKTSCNANFCDRLCFKDKHNAICGCWGAFSKNDSTTRNTVLQFDFKFKSNGKTERITNFTSLRTSRLFFAGERVFADVEALTVHENTRSLQQSFIKVVQYINKNGGWTIVGWYIRGEKQNEDHKEEHEENLLSHGDVNINVSYLYPTTTLHKNIPDNMLFSHEKLFTPATESVPQETNHNI